MEACTTYQTLVMPRNEASQGFELTGCRNILRFLLRLPAGRNDNIHY